MAKWEIKRLFRQEFGKLEGLERRNMWIRFCADLLNNDAISIKVFNKCIK